MVSDPLSMAALEGACANCANCGNAPSILSTGCPDSPPDLPGTPGNRFGAVFRAVCAIFLPNLSPFGGTRRSDWTLGTNSLMANLPNETQTQRSAPHPAS